MKSLIENFLNRLDEIYMTHDKGPVYHGTNQHIAQFDLDKIGSGNSRSDWGYGFYFGTDVDTAKRFGKNIIEAYLSYSNPLRIDVMKSGESMRLGDEFGFDEGTWKQWIRSQTPQQFISTLREKGYDAIEVTGMGKTYEIIVFDPSQIKITNQSVMK